MGFGGSKSTCFDFDSGQLGNVQRADMKESGGRQEHLLPVGSILSLLSVFISESYCSILSLSAMFFINHTTLSSQWPPSVTL